MQHLFFAGFLAVFAYSRLMGHHHHHHGHAQGHSHGHHHHHVNVEDLSKKGENRLWLAIAANMLLTLAQVVGGLISGSLSLVADALHNFSDAAALILAAIAMRIGRKPADDIKTFGYKRAETIAALINLTALIMIGLYLMIEAVQRFYAPVEIEGMLVIWVAGLALIVDAGTAILVYTQSKNSMNMRAAFLHNLTDAAASVGVIIAGICILYFGWFWMDALMTLVIAGYVLWHGSFEIKQVIHLLMEGTPDHINIKDVIAALEEEKDVQNVHHVHIWRLDEQRNALEAHVVIESHETMDDLKARLKARLRQEFSIGHSTLEFEFKPCNECT